MPYHNKNAGVKVKRNVFILTAGVAFGILALVFRAEAVTDDIVYEIEVVLLRDKKLIRESVTREVPFKSQYPVAIQISFISGIEIISFNVSTSLSLGELSTSVFPNIYAFLSCLRKIVMLSSGISKTLSKSIASFIKSFALLFVST